MNVVIVFTSALASRHALVRAIKKSGGMQVAFEGGCIVCKAGDPAKVASRLAGLSGIESVAVAAKVPTKFSDVTGAIVEAGIKAILPDEKFYVRVIQTVAKSDYVNRDIEFASAGTLVGKLAGINALPAKDEQQANHVILAIVGKRSAYVCVKGKT